MQAMQNNQGCDFLLLSQLSTLKVPTSSEIPKELQPPENEVDWIKSSANAINYMAKKIKDYKTTVALRRWYLLTATINNIEEAISRLQKEQEFFLECEGNLLRYNLLGIDNANAIEANYKYALKKLTEIRDTDEFKNFKAPYKERLQRLHSGRRYSSPQYHHPRQHRN